MPVCTAKMSLTASNEKVSHGSLRCSARKRMAGRGQMTRRRRRSWTHPFQAGMMSALRSMVLMGFLLSACSLRLAMAGVYGSFQTDLLPEAMRVGNMARRREVWFGADGPRREARAAEEGETTHTLTLTPSNPSTLVSPSHPSTFAIMMRSFLSVLLVGLFLSLQVSAQLLVTSTLQFVPPPLASSLNPSILLRGHATDL